MIKLIVTDVDDTIVPESSDRLNPEYYEVVRECLEKGIRFGVASGRQRTSIQRLFAPVRDDIFFLGDNGTDIVSRDYSVSMDLEEELYRNLIRDLKDLGSEYHIMACKPGMSYTEKTSEFFYHLMHDEYHYEIEKVNHLEELKGISKVSVWRHDGISEEVNDRLTRTWTERMEAYLAGICFFDFMGKGNNKGKALAIIQKRYGIRPEETAVFGNADNDIPMFEKARYGYAVANGSENLKNAAYEVIGEMKEDAVLSKIKDLIRL